MDKGNLRLKRTAVTALTLALVWLFLLPVQAFAEDGVSDIPDSNAPAVVSDETGGEGVPPELSVAAETAAAPAGKDAGSSEAAVTGTAYLAPSIEQPAGENAVEEAALEESEPEGGEAEEGEPEEIQSEGGEPGEGSPEAGIPQTLSSEGDGAGGAVSDTAGSGDWTRYENNDSTNAIQQAVDAAIAAGQKYVTVVVQDGTYTGGLNIDNSGVDENGNAKETIVVNIIAHDAYKHGEEQNSGATPAADASDSTAAATQAPAANAVYPVPTKDDGTVDTSAISTSSAGGVKLEGGVSVKNVELLLAGIYLTLKEQKENQGKIESLLTDKGNVDVKVEDADSFTYYGTTQGDSANITLTDVENTTIDTGGGDDVIDINTTTSPNVELDIYNKEEAVLKEEFTAADSVDSSIKISTGDGNDKITVTENSKVTSTDTTVSVRKGENNFTVNAGDGADTITLKGGSNLVDIKKDISGEIAEKVYNVASMNVSGHGSTAVIHGGADDDLLNLDTTWEQGTLGKSQVDYQGEAGKNRLHITGTLNDGRDARVSGTWSAEDNTGNISMYSKHAISRTDYNVVSLLTSKVFTELLLLSPNAINVAMSGVDAITDDLAGKKTVDVTFQNGKVMSNGNDVTFEAFTDYVYDPDDNTVTVPSFTNTTGGGLLSKVIIRGQNLTVGENVVIKIPGTTLMLESVNGSEDDSSVLIQGYLEAENIMIKLASTDSHAISFVEQEGDTPSILDVNNSTTVTIASTATLIAKRIVDILAKTVQSSGLLPDLTDLIPGLDSLTENEKVKKINEYVKKVFGFDSLKALEEVSSINFVSIKAASAMVDILGTISAGSVRVSAANKVDTTAANSALRDLGLPFALSVVVGEAGIKVSDSAAITATKGDIYLDAQSDIKVNTTALSGRLPFTVAITVVDNEAYVDISGGKLTSTEGNIIANATGVVNIKTNASGSNVRPNNNAVVPSTDNQASNTTTHVELGKSGGFFAISVMNQDVFSALRGTAEAIAKGDITVTSTAKASVVNNAASNPGEDGESMTLVKLLKTLAGDEKVESDGGYFGMISNAVKNYYNSKQNQTVSQEEKAELEKKQEKRTSALGSFLDKLTGKGENSKGDDVGSLVDKATASANSGKTDSTHSVQLVGALAVTYASNNNKAYIETTGEVEAKGKLSVVANGEMSVDTLADGSPVTAKDPAGGDKQDGPQDQHFAEHTHGVIKVDALTNGTIIMDASVGQNEDGICEVVENDNFPKGIDGFEVFNFVVKACFGYKLQADENGKYWITNAYIRDSDDSNQTDKIEVILVGKDADGCYIYKSEDQGYGGCKVYNGTNVFKAEFVPKQSITVESNAPQLGTVEVTNAQTDGKKLYYADQGEDVYVKVNVKSGVVNFTTPNVTYKVKGSEALQPVTVTEIIKGDIEEDGTLTYYYGFKMPEGDVTIHVLLNGDNMNIKLDLEDKAQHSSDVWITPADQQPSGEAMEKDAVFAGKVGDKIKIVIQLSKDTFLEKNSLMFAGKTPVYIKDITYNGDSQYTCYVNIPAILKTEGDETAGTDLKLTFKTTEDPKKAQGTVESTSTALGAGLAVDVTNYNNQAYIVKVKNNTVRAGSVEVNAATANLSASAASKAGFVAGDLGVAGAITVHLVSANNEALIGGDIKTVTLNGGNLAVNSTIQNSAIVTNADAAGDGADGKNIDPDSVGVGAGIAVGVTNLAVVSRILDSVTIDGTIGDLNINAGHSGSESMSASAGASGGTSAVPVLAMNISGVSVLADSGRMLGNVLNLKGDALIKAANSITRTITADAAAVGGGVGVGASFIIDILSDSAVAKLGRSVKTNGDITVSADSVSRLKATAKSGAKGSVSKDTGADGSGESGGDSGASGEEPPPSGGSDNKVDLPDDYYDGLDNLFGEGSSDNVLTDDDDAESLAPLFQEGEADAFVDSNKQSAQDLSGLVANNNGNVNSQNVGKAFENRQKAETSEGSVQVAATMVLNIQSNTALALIDEVSFIEADGKVSVTSRHDTDGIIMANASATNSTTGVGVAVAINTVTYSNEAKILTNKITASELLVRASVYEEETKKTADNLFDSVKKDVFGTYDSIKNFIDSVLKAAGQGDLLTFIEKYLGDRAISASKEIKSGTAQLIVQWIGELLQGKTLSFPTSEQEDKIKEEAIKFGKAIFEKLKGNFTTKRIKELLLGKDGLLGSLKKNIKNISLKEQAVNAVIHYLSGKLGGNEEAESVGPRISSSAVSGAGASNVGVAGSVAISVVNGTSKAYIADVQNGQMNVSGNVTVESKASQDVYTSAGASVDALGRVDKNKDATDNANSTQGGKSNADSGKSVGVGAAVALSFADLTSEAGIGSGWNITAKDLLMQSKAENNVETTSVSGTDPLARTEDPTDKTDKELTEEEKKEKEKKEEEAKAAKAMDYAVDASVSVTLIQNSVKAYLAANSVITLSGNLNMLSSQSGETNTNASGFAMGNETAVGAAVAINLAFSDVLTQVLGSGTVAGSASLDSVTENQDDANALALAMGAEMERYVAKLKNSEKVMAFNKKKDEEKKEEDKKDEDKKDEEAGQGDDGKIENKTGNKISEQLKRASKVSDKDKEDKSDASQPLSVQAIKSQNVKTESTNQTDAASNNAAGNTVTNATDANTGNAVSGTLNGQAQNGQSIHVAASVGVNVTAHSAKTQILGNLTVGGLKAQVENAGNFTTASTGAAISEASNSNCIGAAVAVSVNGNKAVIEVADGVNITVTGTPAPETEKNADPVLGNVTLNTVLNQNSTGDALGRYGVLAISGSSSGKGGKVGLAGSVAVLVAKGTSAILLGNGVSITGKTDESVAGDVKISATDKSKLSAAALAATKSGGAAAGVGASFALLYAKNEVLAEAGDNFTVSANEFSMTATKQIVDITDFSADIAISDFITILEVDKNGNGGYKTEDADKYGMIVLQKNKNGSYSLFTNLSTADILKLVQISSVLASVNYYASAVAGTVMERKGDTSNQKAAVAGSVSMLFNDSVTRVVIGNNAKITTANAATIQATSHSNTRLLGGALSSSAAKAGIGLNVATVKQNDKVYAIVGNNAKITAGNLQIRSDAASDLLVITAAAVNASGTSVGGGLNVVINNTGAKSEVGTGAIITTTGSNVQTGEDDKLNGSMEILSDAAANVILGSLSLSISGSQNAGASVGAIVSVAANASAAEALLGNGATVTSCDTITIQATNAEQVISVLAAAARSGNGGAGAGTLSVLTTDAKALAGVGDNAKLTALNDITVNAISKAKLIDVMLAAAASTDAPAVGATIMVNVFNRETGAYIGSNSVILSKLGNVLLHADSDESAIIISVAGAAASQNAISGNIQVNVGASKTYAVIGSNANIKAWDSIGVTANQNSTVVAISPTVSFGSGSAAVGATVQTNILSGEVKSLIGENTNLIAYAQNSLTGGVQTANRENKRKGIILSALSKDLVVAGGVSASAGKNAVSGVVETLVNKTIVIAKLGANAVVKAGFKSGESVDAAFSGNSATEQEGELSADADAHSTLVLFGGAFSATSSTGIGATVLTLVSDKTVDAQILLNTAVSSRVNGSVSIHAKAEDLVALISVNFGVSSDSATNAGGNVLIFQNKVNANLTGDLAAAGNVTVQADGITELINAIASVSGGLGGTAVSGAALVTYFQGSTTASVGVNSKITCGELNVLATSIANINADGVGLTASAGSAAVSGLVNIIVTSTKTQAFIDVNSNITADSIYVLATDNYNLLAVAVSLAGGSNGISVTAVVTVAKNTVLAYIGDYTRIQTKNLNVKAVSNRSIRNYAGSVAAGASAGAGVTVMVAVIGGKLDQDSANGIAMGFKPGSFMNGIQVSAPNAAKGYLTKVNLSADIAADDNKASDLHVGDKDGNYSGADGYRNDEFNQNYNSGKNPGENFSDGVTNTQGSELGLAKPNGQYQNVIHAYIGNGCDIKVNGATIVEANEKLNVDIVTASAAIGGTAGVNVGVAVVVAYSNVLAEIKSGAVMDCHNLLVHAISGGDAAIEEDIASQVLGAAGIDVNTEGSSIRVIAITVGIGGTAGVSPSVAVVNMASSSIARMDAVSGKASQIAVKAETVYPNILAVTGAVGIGGSAGISASVAVVTFNSNTYAGICGSTELNATRLDVLSNVNNTAKAYAMSLAGGAVGVNGGVAVVTNRSTTTTELCNGVYNVSGNITVSATVDTSAESFIVGVAIGAVAVGLNAAVVNQHAVILTRILGDGASRLNVSGNVAVINRITATAKSMTAAVSGGAVGIGGNVLLVFNTVNATAALIGMPFAVRYDVTVQSVMKADSQANLASATVGAVAVGLSTSYVGLNAKNLAYLELRAGETGSAAAIRVLTGAENTNSSFHASASTVAGQGGAVSVGLNAAVADIHAVNEAKILSEGKLVGSVFVEAKADAAALAEIYYASAGVVNAAAATAVSVLRIQQLAQADITAIDNFREFRVSAKLNEGSVMVPSYAKLITVCGGVYNANANVAVAYSLGSSIAQAILHTGTNGGTIAVNAGGAADAKSETLNQSAGAFNGSVFVNVAYAKGQFQSLLQILNQVSAYSAEVQTVYTTNSYANLTPSATKLNLSLASFNVNLAIAQTAAKALAALDGPGNLVLTRNLLVKADGSNSSAFANIEGASVNISGFTFGANIADSQMALEQTVRIDRIHVDAGDRIEVLSDTNKLSSTAQTGANGGVKISIAEGKVNSANANVSAVNQVALNYAKLSAWNAVVAKAGSADLTVNAIAKALTFGISGVNAAVTTTEAKVSKFNTGVFMNGVTISGSKVAAEANATGTKVIAKSSVPHFSGSIIGADSILAAAKILEKLTQVIVSSGTIRSTREDVLLRANADATLKADSAHPSVSVSAISVNSYRFNIDVDKILAEVVFDGQIDAARNVQLTADDKIVGDITMDDTTIGGFTGTSGIAKIHVKNQTAHVKAAGDILAFKDILIRAKADQKLSARVDTDSTNFNDHGYAQTDIILYRNAIVDVDGALRSRQGNIDVASQLGTRDTGNKVIYLKLDMYIDTWIDSAGYPTGTGKLVSVAMVNVAEGSLIQAMDVFNENSGTVTIVAKSEGAVLVDVYRYVDKIVGGNRSYSVADVNETVKTNIGGGTRTSILGRNVNIRALTEMDVRSKSHAVGNTSITSVYYPNATVIFCVDLDTVIRAVDISAQKVLNISAYVPYTYVLGHCISEKTHWWNYNSPSVTIKGNIYGDVTIDNGSIFRAGELNVKAFHPADANNRVKIERLAESRYDGKLSATDENTVFDSASQETLNNYRTSGWDKFSKNVKFVSGVYNPNTRNENKVYYSGKLIWSADSISGAVNPSGKTEIYLGSGATGIYVDINRQGQVSVIGLSSSVKPGELVYLKDGVYHVDGSKLLSAVTKGAYSFKYDTQHNSYAMDQSAANNSLTVKNASAYSLQLNHVNQTGSKPGAYLNVTQTYAGTGLILNGSGNFSNGSIYVDLTGGNLKLVNGAQINAQNILICGVGAITEESRNDGKVTITNSGYNGNTANSTIRIALTNALDLILKTANSQYTIQRIQSGGDLTLEVMNTVGKKMPVVLGELISGGNVTVTVPYSLESDDPNRINIIGNSIVVNAGGNVGTSSNYLRIDSSVNQLGGVTVKASGGIYLKEAEGDLHITRIINSGSGDIAIWTQNGSMYAYNDIGNILNGINPDGLEKLNDYLIKYVELNEIKGEAEDLIWIMLQYMVDLLRIQERLEKNGEAVLEEIKKEVDVLQFVNSVEEALGIIAEELLNFGGIEYQNPEIGYAWMNGAVKDGKITDEFNAEMDRLSEDMTLGGLLGVVMVIWRECYQGAAEGYTGVMDSYGALDRNTINISSTGDLYLHLQSATGTANVSHEVNSLTVSVGGKLTITTAADTVLKNVYLESYDALKLDPIVATDVIDLYALGGVYAANKSNQVLLQADNIVLWSLLGNLGTSSQALILNANQLWALSNFAYLENRKDLVVDMVLATEELYLSVDGDLLGMHDEDAILSGIYATVVNIKVTGDVGKEYRNIQITADKCLNIAAQNVYMMCTGDVLVGTIRANGMVSIYADDGSIRNAEQGSGIWCNSLYLYAYGMIGSADSPIMIHSNGIYTSGGGGLMRSLFRMAPARATLTANSHLYGENVSIIPVNNQQVQNNTGRFEDATVTDRDTGIQICGRIEKNAVLVVSDISDHVACALCALMQQHHQLDGWYFVNLKLLGEYVGKLLVRIPVPEKLQGYEGREIVILTCCNGVVWAIRAVVIDGFITFYTEALGSFLILEDASLLDLTEDGTQIILNQTALPFGGWL